MFRRHNFLRIAFLGSGINSHLCSYHLPTAATPVARVSVYRKVSAVQYPKGSNGIGYKDFVERTVKGSHP